MLIVLELRTWPHKFDSIPSYKRIKTQMFNVHASRNIKRAISISYTTERTYNVILALRMISVFSSVFKATAVEPWLYRNSLRPPYFVDNEGYAALPASTMYALHGNITKWHVWDQYVESRRHRQIHALVLEQCVSPGGRISKFDRTVMFPINETYLNVIRSCLAGYTSDFPFEIPAISFILNVSNHHKYDFIILISGDQTSKIPMSGLLAKFYLELETYLPLDCSIDDHCDIHISMSGKFYQHIDSGTGDEFSLENAAINVAIGIFGYRVMSVSLFRPSLSSFSLFLLVCFFLLYFFSPSLVFFFSIFSRYRCLALTLSLSHTHTHSLSLTHTHTHTLSLSLSLSLALSPTHISFIFSCFYSLFFFK